MIACIGSGNMGTALMKGAVEALGGENVGFTDSEPGKAEGAAQSIGAKMFSSNTEAVENADFIFLAVKPQVLGDLLDEIGPAVKAKKPPAVLVSMAAGWSIADIQARTNKKQPVIRIMPNTPALVGQGLLALAASDETSDEQLAEAKRILAHSGLVEELSENYFDAVTGLSGSGPAFVFMFIEALADGAVQVGLPRDKALSFAAQTVLGSATMVKETGLHPGELKDRVASPGGTTIAGIAALEHGGFRGLAMGAVEAAYKRAQELST